MFEWSRTLVRQIYEGIFRCTLIGYSHLRHEIRL